MKKGNYRFIVIIAILTSIIFFNSCEKEKIFPLGSDTVEEFYSIMNKYYYWIDSIPSVDSDNYSSPQELLDAMRFEPRDKWSYITTKAENEQYYVEGEYTGYGFGYTSDSEDNLRITYLYESSELNDFGIERGWIIKEINGIAVNKDSNLGNLLSSNSNSFEFESPTGDVVTKTLSKKIISINTVVYKDVVATGTEKVGYFVFESFIGPSETELTNTFEYFKTENINELVIDLRYNGGGMMSIVKHLAGLIIPENLNGELFLNYKHNSDNTNLNEDINFEVSSNTLGLNKVYFIVGKGSASASEAIINGLEPYLDVLIVGDDTYGKPVGMYSINSRISDLVYVPISFSLVNKDGYGGYFDGLKADSYVTDDVYHTFGSEEAVFAEVLHHIESGSFSTTKSSFEIYRAPVKEIRSIKDERGSL